MRGSFLLFGRSLEKIFSPFNLFGGDITRKYIYIDIQSQELSYQNGCQKTFKCIIPIPVESIPIFSFVQGSEERLEKLKRIPYLQHLCFFIVFFHRFWYQSINKHIPYSRVSFFRLKFEEKCKVKRWSHLMSPSHQWEIFFHSPLPFCFVFLRNGWGEWKKQLKLKKMHPWSLITLR